MQDLYLGTYSGSTEYNPSTEEVLTDWALYNDIKIRPSHTASVHATRQSIMITIAKIVVREWVAGVRILSYDALYGVDISSRILILRTRSQ